MSSNVQVSVTCAAGLGSQVRPLEGIKEAEVDGPARRHGKQRRQHADPQRGNALPLGHMRQHRQGLRAAQSRVDGRCHDARAQHIEREAQQRRRDACTGTSVGCSTCMPEKGLPRMVAYEVQNASI